MSYKRRIAAALLCACFLLSLTSYAVPRDGIYFVAVENMVAPLTEDTMPFWSDGYLYISSDIFTGNIRDALGISRAKIGDGVLLYRGEQSLLFREGYPYAQDSQEETYAPGMVWRDGSAYVPASVTAQYFNLTYSVTNVQYGQLVWLRSAAFTMDDKAFAKAAEFQLNEAYREYLRSLEPEERFEEASETTPEEAPEASGEWEAFPEPDPEGAEPETTPVTPSGPVTATEPVAPSAPIVRTNPVTPSAPATTKPAAPSVPATTPVTPSAPTRATPAAPSAPATTKPATPSVPATATPVTPSTPVAPSAPATTPPVAPSDPAAITEPVAPSEPVTANETPATIGGGQNIYICLRGDASAAALLDALDRRNIRAAVFCDETFLSEQGDLLRRMAATGYRIGLYVAAGPSETVLERLEACNEQLRRVTMEKTRLAYADGAGETLIRAIQDAGFLCPRPAVIRAESLRTSRQAEDLLSAVSRQSGSVLVWLGGTVNRSGLNAFLNDALEVGDAFPPWTETALF